MQKNTITKETGSITNLNDLWHRLAKNIEAVEQDRQFLNQAAEINNAAGKMIKIAAHELEYLRLRFAQPKLPKVQLMEGKLSE